MQIYLGKEFIIIIIITDLDQEVDPFVRCLCYGLKNNLTLAKY